MSNETHGNTGENKTIISFKNSFWLVVILVGLFIAALNFVQAESAGEGEGHGEGKEKTEMKSEKEHAAESAEKKAEEPKHEEAPKADSAKAEK